MDAKEHLKRAIDIVGGQSALARAVGLKQGHVWYWLNKTDRVPAEHVAGIERATAGRVTRHDLRPDLFGPPPHATPAQGADEAHPSAPGRQELAGPGEKEAA